MLPLLRALGVACLVSAALLAVVILSLLFLGGAS